MHHNKCIALLPWGMGVGQENWNPFLWSLVSRNVLDLKLGSLLWAMKYGSGLVPHEFQSLLGDDEMISNSK